MSDTRPPLEYLIACSEAGLESFELSRMNQAANLRKQLRQIVEQWIESEVNARVARCLLDCRRSPFVGRSELMPTVPGPFFFEQLTIPFLPPAGDSLRAAVHQECATVRDVEGVDARRALLIESGTGTLRELESLAGRQAHRLARPRSEHAFRRARESSSTRITHGVARVNIARDGAPPEHGPESAPRPASAGDSQAHLPRGCAA
jgi:hypothetical protein